jgi:hypothetical protein
MGEGRSRTTRTFVSESQEGHPKHQETWHSNNQTNRDGIVMSSDYSGLTRLTDYSVAIV